jgi:hypothetical protein
VGEPSEDDVRSLYGEPPDRFIEARDALAGRLKAEGRPADAAAVKRLKKPTVPAWALNQLAARDPAAIDALLDAGSEIRAAQQAAISAGGRADRLRDAVAARRTAVVRLSNAAAELLRQSGRGAGAHVDDVASALEVAAVDEDAGQRLRSGTFERPPAGATGFGDLTSLKSIPGGGEDAADDAAANEPSRPDIRRLERQRDAARTRGQRAREALSRAAERVASAEEQLQRLRAQLAEAEAAARGTELEERRSHEALRAAGGDVDAGDG